MTHIFLANADKSIPNNLDDITATLAVGAPMTVQQNEAPGLVKTIQFPAVTGSILHAGFYCHGVPARDLRHLSSYLNGDAHDQSKVEWFDGKKFHQVF